MENKKNVVVQNEKWKDGEKAKRERERELERSN
jgi:hypothetical protein